MKNLIVCFSGTGNTYYVARKIAETLEDCKIEMVNNINVDNFVMPERLGILFPTHVSVEPKVIKHFIQEILSKSNDKDTLKYVYSISTAATNILLYGNKRVDKELKSVGITLSYATNIKMPSNFHPSNNNDVNKKIINKADLKIKKVINELTVEKFKLPTWKPRLLGLFFYLLYNSMSKHYSEDFKVDNDCTNCSLCYRLCPSNNISMLNNKPSFGNDCLACTACINNCPENAIYRKKEKNTQYKNPVFDFKMKYRE